MPLAPQSAHDLANDVLKGLPRHRRETFGLRLDRWWDDLVAGLRGAYPSAVADALALRLVRLAADGFAVRDEDLSRLDEARTLRPDWFQSPSMMGYAAYADRFAGDLKGVREQIPYLRELGVTYLHLMPLLQPREGDSDGGYAVADYRRVRPDLGTDDDLQGWVWTTFNSWQWDVDWSNPEVFVEYADIVLFLANAGVEVLRLDAIAFLWKRMGTTCQNEPEVHALTQALRAVVRIACPAVAFKAEAIVGPADLVHYLGHGRHHGRVSDLAYHNSLMVQVWSMLAAGEVGLAVHALRNLPPVPTTTAWVTYVRCHDDIGWAIDDGDAAAVGLSGPAHRAFLSDYYAGLFPGSPARGLVFQHNEATGDRRISGTAASLLGIEAALDAGDAASLGLAVDRLVLAHVIALGWGGVPVLWSGDELALPNDPDWADEEGHGDDNRWAHRPRLPWPAAELRHD